MVKYRLVFILLHNEIKFRSRFSDEWWLLQSITYSEVKIIFTEISCHKRDISLSEIKNTVKIVSLYSII